MALHWSATLLGRSVWLELKPLCGGRLCSQDLLEHDRDIRELIGACDLYSAEIHDVCGKGETNKTYGQIFEQASTYAHATTISSRRKVSPSFSGAPDFSILMLTPTIIDLEHGSSKLWILAVRHDFVPVVSEDLIQICQRILHVGRFVLLAFLVVNGRAHEISRIKGRENDFLQSRRGVELAQAVFGELPS
jgi:hypothetical protein